MKNLFKYVSCAVVTGAVCLMLSFDADAQRGAFHGGGGGGAVRISGGVGFGGGRVGFGFGSGYHGFYGGFYGYPTLGFYLGSLPYGYYPFWYGPYQYYYADGAFYTPYNGGYQVTSPPVGAAVPTLPRGAKSIVIDGQQYYEFHGVYYKVVLNDQGKNVYVVAGKDGVLNTNDGNEPQDDQQAAPPAPKVGDIINQLPDNCRKVTLNSKRYFVAPDDIYYEAIKDANGNTAYRIVSIPDAQ
jgi:hypothetical protein